MKAQKSNHQLIETTIQQQPDQMENLGHRIFDSEKHPQKRTLKTAHCKNKTLPRWDLR